jgi:pimeloyl-ACP methyl ester carboxylesterase/DNA-binding CsgD family transcriptional regulator
LQQWAPDLPAVQYATTPDGVRLAYAVAGEGAQVVCLPFHFNHLLRRWRNTLWIRGLADHFRVVHYDSRGQGLSARGLTRVTTAAFRADLETILEASGFDRFAMVAYGGFAHVALRYAIDQPERITALVLICSSESFEGWSPAAHHGIAEENWDLFLDLQTKNLRPEIANLFQGFIRASASQQDYLRMVAAFIADPDVRNLLARVHVPTLLLHSLDQHWLPPAEGAKVAGKIPGARIIFTDGDVEPDERQAVPAIVDFLKGNALPAKIGPVPSSQITSSAPLSSRQVEVLSLIAEGKRTQEIAQELVLSKRTIERHIADIYARIGARNRSEATAFVLTRPDVLDGGKHPASIR